MKKFLTTLIAIGSVLCGLAAEPTDSFSLPVCQQLALDHNRSLQNARIDIQMADADKAAAFTNYFPSLSVSATGFIAAKDLVRGTMDLSGIGQAYGPALMQAGLGELLMGMPPTSEISMMKKGFLPNAIAMQPLFAGGQIVNGNRLAALQQEVRKLQYAMTEKDILQNVAEYYWQIIALRGNLATLDAVDEQLAAIHTLTENYVNAGMINRNDLLTIELKQQEMASARLQLNNAVELLRLVLCQLCGGDIATFQVAAISDDGTALQCPDDVFVSPAEAVHNREELALAGKNVESKALQVKMERGKNLPSVAVGAAFAYPIMGKSKEDNLIKTDMKMHNLIGLATVSIPVTDWWGGHHAVRKARLAQKQAENDRQDAMEKLQIDILSSWNNLTEAYAQIQIAEKSVVSSTENLRLNRNQYAAGTQPVSDLLDAVTLFTRANNELVSARATYQSRLSEYLRKTR